MSFEQRWNTIRALAFGVIGRAIRADGALCVFEIRGLVDQAVKFFFDFSVKFSEEKNLDDKKVAAFFVIAFTCKWPTQAFIRSPKRFVGSTWWTVATAARIWFSCPAIPWVTEEAEGCQQDENERAGQRSMIGSSLGSSRLPLGVNMCESTRSWHPTDRVTTLY